MPNAAKLGATPVFFFELHLATNLAFKLPRHHFVLEKPLISHTARLSETDNATADDKAHE